MYRHLTYFNTILNAPWRSQIRFSVTFRTVPVPIETSRDPTRATDSFCLIFDSLKPSVDHLKKTFLHMTEVSATFFLITRNTQTVPPFGQTDLFVLVAVAIAGQFFSALFQSLNLRHHLLERFPFGSFQDFVLVLV